jgi:hypothetical protein
MSERFALVADSNSPAESPNPASHRFAMATTHTLPANLACYRFLHDYSPSFDGGRSGVEPLCAAFKSKHESVK